MRYLAAVVLAFALLAGDQMSSSGPYDGQTKDWTAFDMTAPGA